jgi:hypothetical protein
MEHGALKDGTSKAEVQLLRIFSRPPGNFVFIISKFFSVDT